MLAEHLHSITFGFPNARNRLLNSEGGRDEHKLIATAYRRPQGV
jgi:hypothetical protein